MFIIIQIFVYLFNIFLFNHKLLHLFELIKINRVGGRLLFHLSSSLTTVLTVRYTAVHQNLLCHRKSLR